MVSCIESLFQYIQKLEDSVDGSELCTPNGLLRKRNKPFGALVIILQP